MPNNTTPQQIIRQSELEQFVGLRRSQIQELIDQGKFPRPIRLSTRRKAWLACEIAHWQDQRIAERDRSASKGAGPCR
jgi:prophage regulatory protein